MATTVEPTTAPLSTSETGSETFLTPQRLRLLGIGAAAVVVIGGGIWFAKVSGQRKEAAAATALEQARSTAEQGNLAEAVTMFEQVSTTFGGTAAANEAVIGMAQARLVAGQSELAVATLTEFLGKNPLATYASPAQGLLGTAYENTGRFAEAKAAYQKAAELATVDYLKATLLLDAARAARLGKDAAGARAIYEEIIAKYGETAARTEAEVRLGEMTAVE
jgi:outer membrane protein assembly factor BamD (BamD/ComL family)